MPNSLRLRRCRQRDYSFSIDKRPHGALDTVVVKLDASVFEEPLQPIPVVQRIADRFGCWAAGGQFRIRIPSDEPAYDALRTLFAADLEMQGIGTYADRRTPSTGCYVNAWAVYLSFGIGAARTFIGETHVPTLPTFRAGQASSTSPWCPTPSAAALQRRADPPGCSATSGIARSTAGAGNGASSARLSTRRTAPILALSSPR